MGRRPGSKNKRTIEREKKENQIGKNFNVGSCGQPLDTEEIDTSRMKRLKLIGWCPSDGCTAFLTNGDFIDKSDRWGNKYLKCLRCKRQFSEKKLLKEEKHGLDRLSESDREDYISYLDDDFDFEEVSDNDVKQFLLNGFVSEDDDWG